MINKIHSQRKHKPFYYVLLSIGIAISVIILSLIISAAVLDSNVLGWVSLGLLGVCWIPFVFMNLDSKGM